MPDLRYDQATVYRGQQSPHGPKVIRHETDGAETVLGPRYGDVSLPEANFEWGIDSPGADQLAFAILDDAFGPEEATAFYVDFKFDVVADLDDEWTFTAADVADWLSGYTEDYE